MSELIDRLKREQATEDNDKMMREERAILIINIREILSFKR